MTIDIIELAKKSPLGDHLWFDEPDEREAVERFAALYRQALIDSGELVPAEKVKADAVDAERMKALTKMAYQGINRHNECLWALRGLYAKDGESFIEAIDRARSAS